MTAAWPEAVHQCFRRGGGDRIRRETREPAVKRAGRLDGTVAASVSAPAGVLTRFGTVATVFVLAEVAESVDAHV
jgi:hypothetical protein